MIYMVVNLRTEERGQFPSAWDVAMYLWGRDLTDFAIYKYGVRVQWLNGDLAAMQTALEAN